MFSRTALIIAGAAMLLAVGLLAINRYHALRALPSGTGAWFVTYANNQTFGFGPGGNETGFNVILLTKAGAARVAEGGGEWLGTLSGGRVTSKWHETPVPGDDYWQGRNGSALGRYPAPTIEAVLWRYGFGLDLPQAHQTALDAALNSPGSFYAFGRGGLVAVIVPKTSRAYVFYAG